MSEPDRFQTVIIRLRDGREGRFSGRVLVEDEDDGRAAIQEIVFTTPRDLPPNWKLTDVDARTLDEAGATPSVPAGLKRWNGRGWDNVEHVFVAAYSAAEAVRLLKAAGHSHMTTYELKVYFWKTWGEPMKGIRPERGVWIQRKGNRAVERVEIKEGALTL
jgi:hypothetical protein